MNIVGVIAEYNPFHNGHLYHLNKIKEQYKDSTIILVLAGNFTQRGDVSVISKWDKTKIALKYNINLVIELPFIFSTQSANYFAYAAVSILDKLGCTNIVFGSESNNINLLTKIALINENKDYNKLIVSEMEKGISYSKANSNAIKKMLNVTLQEPNDILGVEYIKAIRKLNSNIKASSIKRTNDYHDVNIRKSITSATSIRKNINNKEIIKSAMPKTSIEYLNDFSLDSFFKVIQHEIIVNNNLDDYLGVDEGIENKLKKNILNVSNIDELIKSVKSKRYTYNKLKRMLVHILLKVKKDNKDIEIKYIRVLGFDKKGQKILNNAKKHIDVPIITKYKKEYTKLLEKDVNASKVYLLLFNKCKQKQLLNLEYGSSIIKK